MHANKFISYRTSLRVGLTALGSMDLIIADEIKEMLYTDSSVVGETVGMAIGMVLVVSGAGNDSSSSSSPVVSNDE